MRAITPTIFSIAARVNYVVTETWIKNLYMVKLLFLNSGLRRKVTATPFDVFAT